MVGSSTGFRVLFGVWFSISSRVCVATAVTYSCVERVSGGVFWPTVFQPLAENFPRNTAYLSGGVVKCFYSEKVLSSQECSSFLILESARCSEKQRRFKANPCVKPRGCAVQARSSLFGQTAQALHETQKSRNQAKPR